MFADDLAVLSRLKSGLDQLLGRLNHVTSVLVLREQLLWLLETGVETVHQQEPRNLTVFLFKKRKSLEKLGESLAF